MVVRRHSPDRRERQTLGSGARFLIDYIQMKEDPQRATHAWTIPGAGGGAFDRMEANVQMVEV